MTKPAEIAVVAEGGSPAAAVERELMFLARTLEAVQRKRAYPLERSEFIILRTLAEDGAAAMNEMLAMRLARIETYLADWRPAERQTFGRLLAKLNTALAEIPERVGGRLERWVSCSPLSGSRRRSD